MSEKIPTVDLHRHHDTSHTPRSIARVAREFDIKAFQGMTEADIATMTQAPKGIGFAEWYKYLQKVRLAYVSPQAVAGLTRDTILDAAAEGLDLLELRVSLLSSTDAVLAHQSGRKFWEVAKEILEGIIEVIHETRTKLSTDLIMSISCQDKYLPLVDSYAQLILDYADEIIGLDLTNEVDNPPSRYRQVIERVRQRVKFLTIHCMETQGTSRGWDALSLEPDRIGHGIRILEDARLVEAFCARGIPLEVCPLSNIMTGPTKPGSHPFRQLNEAGLTLTINSDGLNDGTTLQDNFDFVRIFCGYEQQGALDCFRKNAWQHAFRNRRS